MAETLRTEYQVVLTRVGDGALEAAAQLQALKQTGTAAMSGLGQAAGQTKLALRGLSEVAFLAGNEHLARLSVARAESRRIPSENLRQAASGQSSVCSPWGEASQGWQDWQ